jgi:signal recognition particle-docking protein FtsY
MAFSLFGKRKSPEDEVPEAPPLEPARTGFFDRMRQAVAKTRTSLSDSFGSILALTRDVDESTLKSLEPVLLAADVGSATTAIVLENLRGRALRVGIEGGAELKELLKQELQKVLDGVQRPVVHPDASPEVIIMEGSGGKSVPASAPRIPLEVIMMEGSGGKSVPASAPRIPLEVIMMESSGGKSVPASAPRIPLEVIMMVGVNGTGKTTTSGKLAALFVDQGRSVLLCAADTFRAAAIEQLEVWAGRSGVPLIKTKQGGDPSAALYDACTAAKARGSQVLIVDTAGRLHTKTDLMKELDKMRRTAEKLVPGAPHQVLLVMDATTGQNGLTQARLFTEAARVTGIVLTKLDGTAKGGIVLAIATELGLPVLYAGTGEKIEDLIPFESKSFID